MAAQPPAADAAIDAGFRFEARYPLRHTDTFGGTPFVHGGVLLALTEIALDAYDGDAGIPATSFASSPAPRSATDHPSAGTTPPSCGSVAPSCDLDD